MLCNVISIMNKKWWYINCCGLSKDWGVNCVYVTWWSNSMPFIRIRGKMLKLYLSHLGPPCLLRNSEFLQKNAVYLLVKVWVSCWQRAPACTFSARTSIDVPAKTWGKSGALFTVPFWALGWWIRLIESALGRFLGDHPHPSGFCGIHKPYEPATFTNEIQRTILFPKKRTPATWKSFPREKKVENYLTNLHFYPVIKLLRTNSQVPNKTETHTGDFPLCESIRFFHETLQNNTKLMQFKFFQFGIPPKKNRQPNQMFVRQPKSWSAQISYHKNRPKKRAFEKFPLGNGSTRGSHASLERKNHIPKRGEEMVMDQWITMDLFSSFLPVWFMHC